MTERHQVKRSSEEKLASVGDLGTQTLSTACQELFSEPQYTEELRSFFTSLGKRFGNEEAIFQAFQAEIDARPDNPLRHALVTMLQDYESFSAGDSRLSSHMLARHRHVFPVSVLASMWKHEGELQQLAQGLEPLSGKELADTLNHWREFWVSDYLGEFPDLSGLELKATSKDVVGTFEPLNVAVGCCKIEVRESALGLELLFIKNPGFSFRAIINEISETGEKLHGRAIFLKGSREISSDRGLDEVSETALVYKLVPVVPDTASRYTHGDLKEITADRWSVIPKLLTDLTQNEILKMNNLAWVPRPLLAAAAGAYRLHYGFPKEGGIGLGNTSDHGDLFKGCAVFCLDSLAIGSTEEGIVGLIPGFSPAKIKRLGETEFQTVAAGMTS